MSVLIKSLLFISWILIAELYVLPPSYFQSKRIQFHLQPHRRVCGTFRVVHPFLGSEVGIRPPPPGPMWVHPGISPGKNRTSLIPVCPGELNCQFDSLESSERNCLSRLGSWECLWGGQGVSVGSTGSVLGKTGSVLNVNSFRSLSPMWVVLFPGQVALDYARK